MKKDKKKNNKTKEKNIPKKNNQYEEKIKKEKEINDVKIAKRRKKFAIFFLIWICILGIGLVRKGFQNDTFYTIEIGELILDNGIDMKDHFSFHDNLTYTYPHWLYDVFIYLCYKIGGYTGIYISTVVLLLGLLGLIFNINKKITNNNYSIAAFATFIGALAVSGFATARAQLASFLIFALEIYFIELFLKDGKKKYLFGLLILSTLICNIHLAVWPFYFILFLPYLAEYIISFVTSKIKVKKETKFIKFLNNKFIIERNKNIKYLFLTMILSLFTGLLTPLGDTPYTYTFRMITSNAQEYVQEHQMISWEHSPFTIILTAETLFLTFFSKVKLRDLFMILGLSLMSVISIRHISLLALVGTICFARVFYMFFQHFNFDIDNKIINFFTKKSVAVISFIVVIIGTALLLNYQLKEDFVDTEVYPVDALKYIKENINIDEMKLFNEYNFGSYLLHHDIPVFIDSRAELYTKPYSGLDYDIFDDYHYSPSNYREKFEFYGITHALLYKKDSSIYDVLKLDNNYKVLYEDEFFAFFEKLGPANMFITFE